MAYVVIGEVDGHPVIDDGYKWAILRRVWWRGKHKDAWWLDRRRYWTRSDAIKDWDADWNIADFPKYRWVNMRRRGEVKLVKVRGAEILE